MYFYITLVLRNFVQFKLLCMITKNLSFFSGVNASKLATMKRRTLIDLKFLISIILECVRCLIKLEINCFCSYFNWRYSFKEKRRVYTYTHISLRQSYSYTKKISLRKNGSLSHLHLPKDFFIWIALLVKLRMEE